MKRLALPLAFAIVAAAFLEGALLTRKSIPTSGRHVALAPAVSIRAPLPISGGGGGYRFPVRSELAAWAVKHTKGCGHLAGVERWKHNTVTLRLSKCRVTGTFSVRRHRAPSTPRPTSIPTLPPPPTPVQPTPTVALSLPGPTPLPQTPSDYLLARINDERASHGYHPLTLSDAMSNGTANCMGAVGHARSMATQGTIGHWDFPADICGSFYTAGENVGVATGTETQAIDAVQQQMITEPWTPGCSGNHHCNEDNPAFTRIGIGIVTGTYSGYPAWFISEEFSG